MTTPPVVRYKASSPDAKVASFSLLAFTANLRAEMIEPILKAHKIESLLQEEWINEQLSLDILRDIETQFTFEELVAVGVKYAQMIPLPPEINSIESAIHAAMTLYQFSAPHAPPDAITVEQLGPKHYRIIYNIPSPPFSTYGVAYGILQRVKGPNQHPVLTIADFGTPYIFEVKW